MNKYLVTIEFRYNDVSSDGDEWYRRDKITIGVYDDKTLAYVAGNEALELLESKFSLNPNYNKKERFSHGGGCFGEPKHLIGNLGYLQTPFSFYANIEILNYLPVGEKIDQVLSSIAAYKKG